MPDAVGMGSGPVKLAGIAVAALLLGGAGAGHAAVRIADDQGGRIGDYVDKYRDLKESGQLVVVDGLCAGACTLLLGALPRDKICLTSNAKFGFKAAWDRGADGQQVINPGATQALYLMFPLEIRRWIAQQGGLTAHMIFLQGNELEKLYRLCPSDASVTNSQRVGRSSEA